MAKDYVFRDACGAVENALVASQLPFQLDQDDALLVDYIVASKSLFVGVDGTAHVIYVINGNVNTGFDLEDWEEALAFLMPLLA